MALQQAFWVLLLLSELGSIQLSLSGGVGMMVMRIGLMVSPSGELQADDAGMAWRFAEVVERANSGFQVTFCMPK